MSDHPEGLGYRDFDGERSLATRGPPVYGEPTADGWRRWSTRRSKLGWMVDADLDVPLASSDRVLYLGAASGTTVSHLADVVDVVYAVEFAPRPMSDLLDVARDRSNVVPLLADARNPEEYAHVVEADLDLVVQDVATRDQAAVALRNRRFLADDGRLVLAIKARSVDVTAPPDATYERVLERLRDGFRVVDRAALSPTHRDHLGVVAVPDRTGDL